ncbi:permease [Bacillus smithii]|uniref:permease n=1 Tax=Bacillus smithii TaxID=1479 RepID=UPI003D1C8682
MSQTLLQMNTIFISIIIEALPFVVIGVFLSALIQMFVTEEMIAKMIPANRFASAALGSCIGSLFPGCECGIVPITRRLVQKNVPLHAAIAFMLSGPIINPIVIFSTFVAFGDSWKMALYRCSLAIGVSIVVSIAISYLFNDQQLRKVMDHLSHNHSHGSHKMSLRSKIVGTIDHAIDEFFSVGKFLIFGALISSAMQTFFKTSTLLEFGHSKITAVLVMMALAFILSICSEADAFIASSFSGLFGTGPIIAFLVFGAMVDIKNLFMMLDAFQKRFVFVLVSLIAVCVFVGALMI